MSEAPEQDAPEVDQPESGAAKRGADRSTEMVASAGQPLVNQGEVTAEKVSAGEAKTSAQKNTTGFQRILQKVGPVTVKTILDPDAMRKVFARKTAEQEVRSEHFVSAPQSLAVVKCIEKYRRASNCDASWESMAGSGKVRFCQKCNLQVYDFAELNLEEAQELIFQREVKKDVVPFKRKDGKFLSSNCPIGGRNRLTLLAAVGVSSLVLIGLIAFAVQSSSIGPSKTGRSLVVHPDFSAGNTGKGARRGGSVRQTSATPEQLATYAHQVELMLQRAYQPPSSMQIANCRVVLQLALLGSGRSTGFLLFQSSGDADLDTYIVNTALSQTYPAMPFGTGAGVSAEITFDGDKVSVTAR
jgi:hypothetical protein